VGKSANAAGSGVLLLINDRKIAAMYESQSYCFQEASLNPDHPPKMQPFIPYPFIHRENQNSSFVFERVDHGERQIVLL